MKFKALVTAGAIMSIAIPVADAAKPTGANGNTRDSVTGGGQAFLDSRDASGAGDTVAFTAHRARGAADGSDAATGQIQVNRRGEANAVKFHGTISCLVVNGGKSIGDAYMSGTSRSGVPFELYVTDGGTGQNERTDMIMLFVGETETAANDDGEGDSVCGFSSPDFDTVSMARGNVQVRNRNGSEDNAPEDESSSTAAPLSALGL